MTKNVCITALTVEGDTLEARVPGNKIIEFLVVWINNDNIINSFCMLLRYHWKKENVRTIKYSD